MTLFWTFYFALGAYILIPAIVIAWRFENVPIIVKVLGTIIALAVWPVILFEED